MKKNGILTLFIVFSLIPFSYAGSDPIVYSCPTESQLNEMANSCLADGLSYNFYNKDNCKIARCGDSITNKPCIAEEEVVKLKESCRERGFEYEYQKDDFGCGTVRCIENNCPTDGELKEKIRSCEMDGMKWDDYREGECRYIRCYKLVNDCISSEELTKKKLHCEEEGLGYKVYSENGCSYVECKEADCPSDDKKEKIMEECGHYGYPVEEYRDSDGCVRLKCGSSGDSECEKHVSGGCTIIKCNDGYKFNSCEYEAGCQKDECKKYVDEDGCSVKVCADGIKERHCGSNEVKCQVKKTDDGCEIKICSDGFETKNCNLLKDRLVSDDAQIEEAAIQAARETGFFRNFFGRLLRTN